MSLPESHYIYGGQTFEAEFYVTVDGRVPAYEYYENLTQEEQRRFFTIIKFIADSPFGTIFSKTIYNIEDKANSVYAIKPAAQRFFSFMTHDRKIILTNAYRKHSQQMSKIDKESLKLAIRLKRDYEDRRKRGTYYEKT